MIKQMVKWELRRLFKNRKFKIAFTLQLLVILLIIPLFGSYVKALEEGGFFNLSVGGKGYLPIGISSEKNSLTNIISENKRFDILWIEEKEGMELLRNGRISALLVIEKDFEEKIRSYRSSSVQIYINTQNPKSVSAYSELNSILLGFRDGAIEARIRDLSIATPNIELIFQPPTTNIESSQNQNTAQGQGPVNTTNIPERPSNFQEQIERTRASFEDERGGYIVLLVLLLPLFLSGGMLIDLLISEKERRTGEMLLALPIEREKIFYSKFISIMTIILFQLLFWVLALYFFGRIANPLIILPLTITAILLLSITGLIGVYSKNYKDSALIVTVTFILLFLLLFGTSTLYVAGLKEVAAISPLSLVIAIENGTYSLKEAAISILPSLSFSLVLIYLSTVLYRKDEFYFGPRPTISDLIFEFAGKLQFNRKIFSPYIISLIFGFIAIFISIVFEIFFGIITLYFTESIFAILLLWATIEEFSKSIGVFSAKKYYPLKWHEGMLAGMASGLGFALLENIIFTFFTLNIFPDYAVRVFIMRTFLSGSIHILSTGVIGIGIAERKYLVPFFLLGILIHFVYNLTVLQGVL
ncbi:MAG: ABC-2 family transporter protein [Candidatus Methanofastidiosum methylothiophilum]|uniref:ABC-2 family transporter protein n=1 Tax=Candidatus Methanofastidiosum methylothiophilum TaxID=1705564 RepID=A0A150IQY2_9EURY|nr:MAG: ABC-2 family transporter protein [Candidatus Methanofastidiosum methylthiophilus]KYC47407.1 MAG: ABC-2 family transporter protein [Candidatus Methanofastidiosum methylthiophilus]KYC49591.1 MAG: ABC-2 family transporter protein [Candidatus Methanofastidiosum methylthiophilus]